MNAIWSPILALAGGYLFGSIFSAIWICRLFHIDITRTGSGNPGMTNVWRTLGWKPALTVALLDAAKGFTAAWLGSALTHSLFWSLMAGIAAVAGHSFSIFAGFKGGKGVLTAFGAFLFLSPIASLSSLTVWLLVLLATRYVSLGSLGAAVTLPLFIFLEARWHGNAGLNAAFWAALPVSAFVIYRHRANIGNLLQGKEPRIGSRKN